MAIIHAQPYTDADLKSFLAESGDCPAFCFMGIKPGITTAESAIKLLKAHQWVKVVHVPPQFDNSQILWEWNGSQSELLQSEATGILQVENGVVKNVMLQTRIPFGRIYLLLGQPDVSRIVMYADYGDLEAFYGGTYLKKALVISAGGQCPISNIWDSEVAFTAYHLFEPSKQVALQREAVSPNSIARQCLTAK
jgi:hypothetical protein